MRPLVEPAKKIVVEKTRLEVDTRFVEIWLHDSDAEIQKKATKPYQVSDDLPAMVFALLLLDSFIFFVVQIATHDPKVVVGGFHWHPADWLWVAVFIVAIALVLLAIHFGFRGKKLCAQKKAELVAEREHYPLFQRASLITTAANIFNKRRDFYEYYEEMTEKGLAKLEEDEAEKFRTHLLAAHGALVQSVENFRRAAELDANRRKFIKSHPQPDEDNGTALAELMAKLDQPPEIPRLRITEIGADLERDNALVELISDQSGEHELAAKIDALAQKR